jgi:hypothetical protein
MGTGACLSFPGIGLRRFCARFMVIFPLLAILYLRHGDRRSLEEYYEGGAELTEAKAEAGSDYTK